MTEIRLPSLGEGIEKGTIVSILVKVGDQVSFDQPLLEVETDKVTIEIPSEQEGEITAILVKTGDEIPEGTVILQIKEDNKVPVAEVAISNSDVSIPVQEKEIPLQEILQEKDQTKAPEKRLEASAQPIVPSSVQTSKSKPGFRASPLARKMAREIGIDIHTITPSRASGRVSVQDVKAHARALNQGRSNGQFSGPSPSLPDFSKWGNIRRESMSGIAQATSKNMRTAWSQIPHAWLQEKADITDVEQKRQLYKTQVKAAGGSLTITAILVKVLAKALEKFPLFNASIDEASKEIIYKEYIHIGVAVDTEKGLVVPKITDANQKSITEIALALNDISQKARDKKLTTHDLEGASFTISNLGGIGTTAIFPIVNFPQVAILGVAASKKEALWVENEFHPRLMMPMTIGFDHRVINGADAARFLQYVKQLLEDWFLWNL